MISIETENFFFNRLLLLLLGLWPYQKSIFVRLQIIFCHGILISFVLFQFAALLTSDYSMNAITRILSNGFMLINYTVIYSSFYINGCSVKYLLEELQYICNDLKNMNEIAIIVKYGRYAKYYTLGFTVLFLLYYLAFIFSPIGICILDVILPSNDGSRQYRLLQSIAYHYFNQKKHIYLIVVYVDVSILIGGLGMIGTGTILMSYLQHACAIFSIVSYRIKHAMRWKMLRNINFRNEYLIYEEIICAVEMHCKAIKFSNYLISNFNLTLFFTTLTGVLSWSINLFRISQILLHENISADLIIPIANLAIQSLYGLMSNIIAQDITDHNDFVFVTAYNVPWYVTPLRIQKEILFVLQKGAKAFHLNICGLYSASLEGLTSLASTAVSYFTVMHSISS